MQISDEMVEAFGNAFWSVNAASKIDGQREHIRSALEAALSTDADPVAWQAQSDDGVWRYVEMPRTAKSMGMPIRPLYAEPVKTAPAVAVKATDAPYNIEAIAKVISLSYGENPEDDAPLSKICGPNNEPLPNWLAYEEQAKAVFIWMDAVISALSAQVQDVAVPALKIGIYGKAYDRPDERRAYTYDEQPHNVEAYKLGRVCSEIHSGGDWIDRGLNLLKALQREGFGVFELPASPASKHGDAE